MIRTSIILPAELHQHLVMLARQEGKKLSEFLRERLTIIATHEQETSLDEMYGAIGKLNSMIKDDVADTSQTIDEALYGANGAWRGNPGNHGIWQSPQSTQTR